jgi:hypothetical protein
MLTKPQKINLTPLECIEHASDYAQCAGFLLRQNAELVISPAKSISVLYPMWSLLHAAFELLFKSYAMHSMRTHKHIHSLLEYLEAFDEIKSCLTYDEILLIKKLMKKQSLRKGFHFEDDVFENLDEQLIFSDKCLQLFEKMMTILPIELHQQYHY